VDHPSHAILEIRPLSFSTGQPHPLAEQPIIFIDKKVLPLDTWGVQITIIGDFLILLATFSHSGRNKDMFFLVRWKSGLTYCVSIRDYYKVIRSHRFFKFSLHLPNGEPIDILLTSRKTPS
jgi:hypothetical protein